MIGFGQSGDDGLRRPHAADRPCVVNVLTDPEVAFLPPHITFEQAKMFALAVAKGDSGRRGMLEQSLKDKLAEFLPGRR